MFDLSGLPVDVYHVIHQYLLNYDYHEFLNTSKAVFSEVKYRTMHYHLRCRDPFVQEDAGIISDIVTSKVMNKSAQISISHKFDSRFEAVISSPRLNNIYIPIDVHTLKLQNCYHNDNLCFTGREGGHLHTLEIYGKRGNDAEYDFSSISVTFPFLQKLVAGECRAKSVIPLFYIPHIELTDVVLPGVKTSGHLSSDYHDINLHHIRFHYDVTYRADASLISTLLAFKDVQDLSLTAEFVNSNSPPGYSLSCQSLSLTSVEKQTCFPLRLNKPKKLFLCRFDLKNLTIDDITELEKVSLCECSNFDMTLFRNAKIIKIEHSAAIGFANTLNVSDLTSFQFLTHVS
jgi:hypothetical protein